VIRKITKQKKRKMKNIRGKKRWRREGRRKRAGRRLDQSNEKEVVPF